MKNSNSKQTVNYIPLRSAHNKIALSTFNIIQSIEMKLREMIIKENEKKTNLYLFDLIAGDGWTLDYNDEMKKKKKIKI